MHIVQVEHALENKPQWLVPLPDLAVMHILRPWQKRVSAARCVLHLRACNTANYISAMLQSLTVHDVQSACSGLFGVESQANHLDLPVTAAQGDFSGLVGGALVRHVMRADFAGTFCACGQAPHTECGAEKPHAQAVHGSVCQHCTVKPSGQHVHSSSL